jgi:hypothetical protein
MSEKNKLFIIQQIEYKNFDYQVSSVDISQIKEAGMLAGTAYEQMNEEELLNHFQQNPSDLDEFIPLFDESPEILEDNTKIHGTNSLDPHSVCTTGYLDETELVNKNFSNLDTFQLCQILGNDMELRSKTRDELLAICKERISN